MTAEEVKQAIENKQTVYYDTLFIDYGIVTLELNSDEYMIGWNGFGDALVNKKTHESYYVNQLYNDENALKHYKAHNIIVREERLPYITWEDFKDNEKLEFQVVGWAGTYILSHTDAYGHEINKIVLYETNDRTAFYPSEEWPLTEEGFYEAYEKCKKLFLGE